MKYLNRFLTAAGLVASSVAFGGTWQSSNISVAPESVILEANPWGDAWCDAYPAGGTFKVAQVAGWASANTGIWTNSLYGRGYFSLMGRIKFYVNYVPSPGEVMPGKSLGTVRYDVAAWAGGDDNTTATFSENGGSARVTLQTLTWGRNASEIIDWLFTYALDGYMDYAWQSRQFWVNVTFSPTTGSDVLLGTHKAEFTSGGISGEAETFTDWEDIWVDTAEAWCRMNTSMTITLESIKGQPVQ